MIPYLGKEEFHTLRILVVNDVDELSKLLSDLCHLTRCVWVEEDFLQQVIIFVEHALGYLHVALEGGAGASWCFITAAKAKVLTKGILSE